MKLSGSHVFYKSQQHQLSCCKKTYLIAPGSTVISAAAISFEIVKVLESAILTVPPLCCVASTFWNWKENDRVSVHLD
jgi:hypothetical protein